uniref:NB-ARC domain-containing protein n=1 Tax=Oryza barthii TaxID=65489 RepID=A0A0D3F3C1_9ORYZ
MDVAVGAASWLLGKVVTQLSDGMVAAYVASTELGLNMEQIKTDLAYTQGLLDAAEERDVRNNHGLRVLLEILTKQADEAEDVLDELQYFIIQDQIDGTHEATPMVDDGLRGQVLIHGRHALHHTTGNWLSCFCCSSARDDADDPHDIPKSHSDVPDHVSKLTFNRVDMSNKIKLVIEGIHASCTPVSNLLKIIHPAVGRALPPKRPPTSSTITQDKLYGRENIFNQTLDAMTNFTIHSRTLSVIPIVGPGGIGKTTFAQYLYNDKTIEAHFSIKVWVCVSTHFDVVKLTQEILKCIYHAENEGSRRVDELSNLDQLQITIAQRLKSNRFLLVLDDMWKCGSEAEWGSLLAPFSKGDAKECIFGHDKPEYYEDNIIDIARKISKKLKGFPLAAKSVGRLLKYRISQERWIEILERNEWQHQRNDDDIMPALQISYDYLPFYLKRCFSYCALYPEDYHFNNIEISHFWEALGIIDSGSHKNRAEDIGLKYLDELEGNGFLVKKVDDRTGRQYYVMHDLLHELAQNISSQECINISSYDFRSDNIPWSIRHVSITLQDNYEDSFEREMENFKRKIDIGNLRTLMLFGEGNASMLILIKDLLKETKRLRVLFMHANSLQSFPHNFSKLIHLRYLKLEIPYDVELSLPNAVSRFYHLKFLDLGYSKCILPKDINHLVNLCLLNARKELCSNIPGIGKMKYLQRSEEYHVKKRDIGFELSELGDLTDLGGELKIFNLEKVATREEANKAKLMSKRNMEKLVLAWGMVQRTTRSDVLEGLQPPSNLKALVIKNPGGSIGPSWLCGNICVNYLKSLHIEGVSWGILPPFGQLMQLEELTLNNIPSTRRFGPNFGGVTQKSFSHLKKVEFVNMPELVEWVGGAHCHLFSKITSIRGALVFDNLDKVEDMSIEEMPHVSLTDLQKLSSLTRLAVKGCESMLFSEVEEGVIFPSVQQLEISDCRLTRNSLTKLLNRFPALTEFHLKFSSFEVGEEAVLQLPSSNLLSYVKIWCCKNLVLPVADGGGLHDLSSLQEVEIRGCGKMFDRCSMVEAGARSNKFFPASLRELNISDELSIQSMALLTNLTSLTHLTLINCDNLTVHGFDPLITCSLKELVVYKKADDEIHLYSVADDLFLEVATRMTKVIPAGGSYFQQLEKLEVDSISAVLVSPICSLLAANLRELRFRYDLWMESFTEEQEEALQLLTSLQCLKFRKCLRLQSLPEGLHCLYSLYKLNINGCPGIMSLPKDGFPASLERLRIRDCSIDLMVQVKELEASNLDLHIRLR